MSDDAFDAAQKPDGKHHGFYQQYRDKSKIAILKAIRTYDQRMAQHQAAIANPEQRVPNFAELDPRQQRALLNEVWPKEIANYREQIEILQGILAQRRL